MTLVTTWIPACSRQRLGWHPSGARVPSRAHVRVALVGNEAFAASLATVPLCPVVDDDDLVATLPPEDLGFRHAGEPAPTGAPKEPEVQFAEVAPGTTEPAKTTRGSRADKLR